MKLMGIHSLYLISTVTMIVISILPIYFSLYLSTIRNHQINYKILYWNWNLLNKQNVLAKFEEQQKQYEGNRLQKYIKMKLMALNLNILQLVIY